MSTCIVHLSDIHFRSSGNWISGKAAAIVRAARAEEPACKCFVVVLSGDVGYSGAEEEYNIASSFLASIRAEFDGTAVHFVIVPGNHDCDFRITSRTRELLIAQHDELAHVSAPDVIDQCTAVQDNYFRFLAAQTNAPEKGGLARLYDQVLINTEGGTICLDLLNTAWLSQRHEQPAKIVFPTEAITGTGSELHTCRIAILHHPLNWLAPDNARQIRALLERSANVILTGHEHVQDSYYKILEDDSDVTYCEGAVLQCSKGAHSGFATILIDPGARTLRITEFEWKGGFYQSRLRASEKPLSAKKPTPFTVSEAHSAWLDDVGTGFTHNRVPKLLLKHLFIFPDVSSHTIRSDAGGQVERRRQISGSQLLEHVETARHLLISSQALGGKTTLAKVLFAEFYRKRAFPLILLADDLPKLSAKTTDSVMSGAFHRQYKGNWEQYRQLDGASKVLLIDDFDHSPLNGSARQELIDALRLRFGRIILFTDEFFSARVFRPDAAECTTFADFVSCQILEFGHLLRGKLIEKWELLGRESTMSREGLNLEVKNMERVVNGMMLKNVVPSLPIMTLTILQTWEATKAPDLSAGSYGYLHQILILRAIATMHLTPSEADVAIRFLALVAYHLFATETDSLTKAMWTELTEQYFREFTVRVPEDLRL